MPRITIKIRTVDRYIFAAISTGQKKIETRAATPKYQKISVGDTLTFACGKDRLSKRVVSVERFRTIGAILKKYKPAGINPKTKTAKEARDMWLSFPGYREKIKEFGLLAWRLR